MNTEALKGERVDFKTALKEVLGDDEAVLYYLTGFTHFSRRIDGKSGYYLVHTQEGNIGCVVIVLGYEEHHPPAMTIKVGRDGTLIKQGTSERYHLYSPLIKPARIGLVPEGAFAIVSHGGSLVFLGLSEKTAEGKPIKKPAVLYSCLP